MCGPFIAPTKLARHVQIVCLVDPLERIFAQLQEPHIASKEPAADARSGVKDLLAERITSNSGPRNRQDGRDVMLQKISIHNVGRFFLGALVLLRWSVQRNEVC